MAKNDIQYLFIILHYNHLPTLSVNSAWSNYFWPTVLQKRDNLRTTSNKM